MPDPIPYGHRPEGRSQPITPPEAICRHALRSLYYPRSPYEFSVLPAEILGQVYEQFLGRIIVFADNRQVSVEQKPEVKMSGGVYYTPAFVVRHIIERTLAPLLESFTPQTFGSAEKLRIVDPACGSGSFLIGAYQHLLDWHRDKYLSNGPERHPDEIYQGKGGRWLLATQEKKRILLESIYGVDIDAQAVEVTKLSLLLKVLEDETEESIASQLRLFHERALPDLDSNIKCGNSLIGPDFYRLRQSSYLDDESHLQINVFDWDAAFPSVMKDGGFDAVIGNPPYFNIDDTWGKGGQRRQYIKQAYPFVYNDKTDVLFYFLAKAVQIGRGEFGFIVSRAFLEAYKADKLRKWLADQTDIREITDFQSYPVFEGVGITTAAIFLTKREPQPTADIFQLVGEGFRPEKIGPQQADPSLFRYIRVSQDQFGAGRWSFATQVVERINSKVDSAGQPLGSVLFVGKGMETGRNNVFGKIEREQIEEWGLRPGQYFMRARNSDILRYRIKESGEYVVYVEDFEGVQGLANGLAAAFACTRRAVEGASCIPAWQLRLVAIYLASA